MTPAEKAQLARVEKKTDRAIALIIAFAEMQRARAAQDKGEHDASQAKLDELIAAVEADKS